MNVIFALFLIAGIHSTTNCITYEQVKKLFDPANTQSSSEEPLIKKRHTFIGVCFLFTLFNMQILHLCHRWHRRNHDSLKYLKGSVLQK